MISVGIPNRNRLLSSCYPIFSFRNWSDFNYSLKFFEKIIEIARLIYSIIVFHVLPKITQTDLETRGLMLGPQSHQRAMQ